MSFFSLFSSTSSFGDYLKLKKVDRMECATFDRIFLFVFLFSFSFLNSQQIQHLPRADLGWVWVNPLICHEQKYYCVDIKWNEKKIMAMGQNRKNKNEIVFVAMTENPTGNSYWIMTANAREKNVLLLRQFITIYLNRPGWLLDGDYALWIRCEMRACIFQLIENFFTYFFLSDCWALLCTIMRPDKKLFSIHSHAARGDLLIRHVNHIHITFCVCKRIAGSWKFFKRWQFDYLSTKRDEMGLWMRRQMSLNLRIERVARIFNNEKVIMWRIWVKCCLYKKMPNRTNSTFIMRWWARQHFSIFISLL